MLIVNKTFTVAYLQSYSTLWWNKEGIGILCKCHDDQWDIWSIPIAPSGLWSKYITLIPSTPDIHIICHYFLMHWIWFILAHRNPNCFLSLPRRFETMNYKLQLSKPALVCFFQAGGLFSIENARFCPVSVRFVQCWLFFMNLRIFYRTFYRPKKYTGESKSRNIMYDYMKCTTFPWHTFLGKYQMWQTTCYYGISRVYWSRIDWLIDGNGKIGHHDK